MRTRSDGQLDAEVRLSRTISPRRLPSNGGICKSSPKCMLALTSQKAPSLLWASPKTCGGITPRGSVGHVVDAMGRASESFLSGIRGRKILTFYLLWGGFHYSGGYPGWCFNTVGRKF